MIVYTDWEGRSPDLVEDQITYPISTRFIAAPKVKFVRGESMFGKSFVYVIFEDGTDIYWARSRVIEYLNSVRGMLPEGVNPVIGPDATGVGWVFEYALVDETGKHDLAELRSFQDWHLRYALESVKGVAEVAPVGGFVKQYQVDLDPNKLLAYNIPLSEVVSAIKMSNADVGGKIFEVATTEYFVRGRGYIKSIADIENIVLKVENGTPVYVQERRHRASRPGHPAWRRGTGRQGRSRRRHRRDALRRERAHASSTASKRSSRKSNLRCPKGCAIVPTYDRSELINRAIDTLREKLIEESIVVALVCIVFLWHVRSALVAIITLPIAIILSFIPMLWLGLTSNIMSLGGIAIAIGAMVDAAIIMVENAHKALEHFRDEHGRDPDERERAEVIIARRQERRTPALLLAAGHHGELHSGVFAGSAGGTAFQAAGVHEDLLDVLRRAARRDARAGADGLADPRQDHPRDQESDQPFPDLGLPAVREFRAALPLAHARRRAAHPGGNVFIRSASLARNSCRRSTKAPFSTCRPPCPACRSPRRRRFCKSRTACCARFPRWRRVFGKAGQAETPTDPAPLSMFETVVTLKPPEQWRPGMTWEKLLAEMNEKIKTPGMANIFWMPIQTRTEMLTTGFRTILGIKVFGPDLEGDRKDRGADREGAERFSGHAQRLRRAHHRRLLPRLRP